MMLPESQLFFHLICLCMLPYSPYSLCPLQGRQRGGRTLASLLLLLSRFGAHCGSFLCGSSETVLPLDASEGTPPGGSRLRAQKSWGKILLRWSNISFQSGSLPPIILSFRASTEARKCPVYSSATHSHTHSLSLSFWYFLIPFTHFSYPHPHFWQSILCICELVLLFLFFQSLHITVRPYSICLSLYDVFSLA